MIPAPASSHEGAVPMDGDTEAWLDRRLAGCRFVDERLNKRRCRFVALIRSAIGQTMLRVCQDWAKRKASYRFLADDRGSEANILAGYFRISLIGTRSSESHGRPYPRAPSHCQVYH